MPPKAVNFEDYIKWFNNHEVVVKGQTASGVKFETTNATGKALLKNAQDNAAAIAAATPSATAKKADTSLCYVPNHFGNGFTKQASEPFDLDFDVTEPESAPGADFEAVFEYVVDEQGDVMIKCDGHIVGPAVSVDWEREVEEEVVGDGGGDDEEWDLV